MQTLKDSDFKKTITDGVWIVFFWASWCRVCSSTQHLLDFEKENPNVKIGIINVDENPHAKNLVFILPTYILFKNGVSTKKLIGIQSQESLESIL